MRASIFSALALCAAACAALFGASAHAQMGGDARHRPPPCSTAHPCPMVFLQDGLYGVRTAGGTVTIAPRFHRAEMAAPRLAGAHGLILTYDENGRMGFVGRDGREISAPQYTLPTTSGGAIFVSIAGAQNARCAFDQAGRQILPCQYTSILSSDRGFMGLRSGAQTMYDFTGASISRMAAAPTQQSAARPAPPAQQSRPAPAYNRARALADTRNWDDALRAVLNGPAEDQAYVLVAIYRVSAPSDTRYWPMLTLLSENQSIFDSARRGATPEQQRQIAALRVGFNNYELRRTRDYGPAPTSGHTIRARTVGECHSAGGTVSVMGFCRR